MRILKTKIPLESQLLEEYKLVAGMWKTYRISRGTLFLASIAGIGILSNIYRDAVQTFRVTRLTETGLSITERVIPDVVSAAIASLVLIVITVWVIFIDLYLEHEQRICAERCKSLAQNLIPENSFVWSIHASSERQSDPFYLGRGLLIMLSSIWIATYIGLSLATR